MPPRAPDALRDDIIKTNAIPLSDKVNDGAVERDCLNNSSEMQQNHMKNHRVFLAFVSAVIATAAAAWVEMYSSQMYGVDHASFNRLIWIPVAVIAVAVPLVLIKFGKPKPAIAVSLQKDPNSTTKTKRDPTRKISWKELKEHTTEDDSWIALHGKVYDISKFAKVHPGGGVISEYAGRNASDEFEAFHTPRVRRRLPAFCIGTLVDAPAELPSTRDYRQLRTKLWEKGWFEADLSYFVWKDILALSILMVGVYFMASGESAWVRMVLGGVAVGLAIQQIAFVAHDAGHRGIFHPQPGGGINWAGWFHGTLCFGVSIEMWSDEHSRHHAYTMRPREDPQFNYLPVFLVSKKEMKNFGDLSKLEQFLAKLLVPLQYYTLIPISVIIGRFNLHIISMFYALKNKKFHDVVGLLMYCAWFGTMMNILPAQERIPFLFIAYITAGILHVQLTISHLATDAFTAEEDEKLQFFAFQMRTTRNIDCSWWDDWFHGGLQYQIEHHLFPQMPRHYLAKTKPLVEELCKKHDLPYRSTSLSGAVSECLSDLHSIRHFIDDLAYPHEIMPVSE